MMECDGVNRVVSRWQAGDSPTKEEVQGLECHLTGCRSCRNAWGTIAPMLLRDARETGAAMGPALPAGLEDRIMDTVHRQPAPHPAPRRLPQWNIGIAIAAVLVAAMGLAGGLALRSRATTGYLTVTLVLDTPEARSVALAGDFTGWQTAGYELAKRSTDGKWEITVRLRRDRSYAYCFVVDGERWVPDPTAPETVEDGFGGINSILRL
jgi:hypothetical protein